MAVIRAMEAADIRPTARLFEEMQAHYGVPCPPRDEIVSSLADLPPGVTVLVAAEAAEAAATDPAAVVIGFAAVATLFPGPGLRKGLFLKELYVSASARDGGLGAALMRATARFAIDHGFARLDWTADGRDARLLRFYEATGASHMRDKAFMRLAGDALAEFAQADCEGPR